MKIIIKFIGKCFCNNKKIIGAFKYYMDKDKNCCAEFGSQKLECPLCKSTMELQIDYIKIEEKDNGENTNKEI